MLVATSVRRSFLAVIVIIASVLGSAAATTASMSTAGQARPAMSAAYSVHVLAGGSGGPDDTPWG